MGMIKDLLLHGRLQLLRVRPNNPQGLPAVFDRFEALIGELGSFAKRSSEEKNKLHHHYLQRMKDILYEMDFLVRHMPDVGDEKAFASQRLKSARSRFVFLVEEKFKSIRNRLEDELKDLDAPKPEDIKRLRTGQDYLLRMKDEFFDDDSYSWSLGLDAHFNLLEDKFAKAEQRMADAQNKEAVQALRARVNEIRPWGKPTIGQLLRYDDSVILRDLREFGFTEDELQLLLRLKHGQRLYS